MDNILKISFGQKQNDFHNFDSFNQDVIDLIRDNCQAKIVVVIDKGWGLPDGNICLVMDHINLTGDNPLNGENHSCGPRFFKMTDLYITECDGLGKCITAGIKDTIKPDANDISKLTSIGADCWSYNLVPTSIVAAHAGLRVLAILTFGSTAFDETVITKITQGVKEMAL